MDWVALFRETVRQIRDELDQQAALPSVEGAHLVGHRSVAGVSGVEPTQLGPTPSRLDQAAA